MTGQDTPVCLEEMALENSTCIDTNVVISENQESLEIVTSVDNEVVNSNPGVLETDADS
jgi:hypothetical protein